MKRISLGKALGHALNHSVPCCKIDWKAKPHSVIAYCPIHAAAPMLLEALEDVLESPDSEVAKRKARAAIAQARGES